VLCIYAAGAFCWVTAGECKSTLSFVAAWGESNFIHMQGQVRPVLFMSPEVSSTDSLLMQLRRGEGRPTLALLRGILMPSVHTFFLLSFLYVALKSLKKSIFTVLQSYQRSGLEL
jgi:hypothetical protein